MTTASLQVWRTELQVSVRAAIDADLLDGCLRGAVAAWRRRPAGPSLTPSCAAFASSRDVRAGQRPVAGVDADGVWPQPRPPTVSFTEDSAASSLPRDTTPGPASEPPSPAIGESCAWQDIEIDPTVRYGSSGMVLDLGATAKAWLADTVARDLAFATGADALANMGGDIRCISAGEPWTIWLDPELPGVDLVAVDLRDAGSLPAGWHAAVGPAVTTSSIRTAAPAQTPWWSAAVIAADRGANTAATAAMVLGAEAPGWLDRPRIVCTAGDGRRRRDSDRPLGRCGEGGMTTWMLLRTTGFLVLGLLTLAVALGLAGPGIRDPRARLVAVTVHRTAAVTGTVLLLAHVTAAVVDLGHDLAACGAASGRVAVRSRCGSRSARWPSMPSCWWRSPRPCEGATQGCGGTSM